MSWSIHFVGRSVDVNKAIHDELQKITDSNSQREYAAAMPHLIALLELNQSEEATSGAGPDVFLVSVRANGSAWWDGEKRVSSTCYAEIKRLEGRHIPAQS